ncbi:MAG: PAS domain S-box protein, partial [Limisphaerales bacterium]
MREAKNFLVVEDNQADFLLIQRRLKEHGMTARYHRVDRLEDLKAAINAGGWDAVLCDYSVPQMDFLDCYNLIQTELPDVPVILVSGALGEEKAVEMVELGLWGFVLKGNLARLPFVIERGLQAAVDRRAKRAAEAALRASEERARAITESAQDAILTMDTQGRVSFWNPAAERIFGYTRAEAVGQKLHDLIAPARYHDAFHAAFPAFQQTGQGAVMGRTVDLEACRKDGREISVQLSLSAIHMEDGWNAMGIIRDATERKAAEAALRQAGAYNRSLIEASLDPLVTIGPDGRITDVNGATEAATGRTRRELIGTDFSNYFTDPGQARAGYQQVFRDQSVRDYPLELRHRDGRVIPVLYNASVYRDEAGQVIGVFAAARDISGLKQAEEHLRLQGAALAAAANEVVITDRSGTIQWVNPAFTRTTGYTLKEAVGQNPRVLKSGKHDQAFYKHLWDTILRGEVWRGEITNHKKDLSQFTEEAIITPVKDGHGKITHFIAIKQDITEKKLLEAKFLRAQRLEGLGALAGGVAHDLNNVLAPILMCAEMLRARSSDEGAARMLEMIETGAKRGAGMIRQILSFARGTSGEKIVMHVEHLLTELRKMMEETFPPGIQCV